MRHLENLLVKLRQIRWTPPMLGIFHAIAMHRAVPRLSVGAESTGAISRRHRERQGDRLDDRPERATRRLRRVGAHSPARAFVSPIRQRVPPAVPDDPTRGDLLRLQVHERAPEGEARRARDSRWPARRTGTFMWSRDRSIGTSAARCLLQMATDMRERLRWPTEAKMKKGKYWVRKWNSWVEIKAELPGVYRRKEGGFLVRGQAIDPKTGAIRQVVRNLPELAEPEEARLWLKTELDSIRKGASRPTNKEPVR